MLFFSACLDLEQKSLFMGEHYLIKEESDESVQDRIPLQNGSFGSRIKTDSALTKADPVILG